MNDMNNVGPILILRPQFCRKGIHPCIPAVTLYFRNDASPYGEGRLHWCANHATDADAYRPSAIRCAAQRAARGSDAR